jgi:hypothetical protein
MLKIIDHGEWVHYTPDPYPFPPTMGGATIVFARRVSDGRDWYDLRKELTNPDSIWVALLKKDDDWSVLVTTDDVSTLYPANNKVLELTGLTENHETLRQQLFNPKTKTFAKQPPPPRYVTVFDLIFKELGWDNATVRRKLQEANKHHPKWRPPEWLT